MRSTCQAPEPLLTTQEVADLLKISVKTVREYIHQGRLKAIDLNPEGKRPTWRIITGSLPTESDRAEQIYLDAKRRIGL
jgi:excisionase family DNA binding protein